MKQQPTDHTAGTNADGKASKAAGSSATAFLFAAALTTGAISACNEADRRIAKGFRLPDGDVEKGKTAFVESGCNACHPVAGVELPAAAEPGAVHFELGGDVVKVKTYGELVTSIIRPQHVLAPEYVIELKAAKDGESQSPMPNYNEAMTVQQLTDIVTFLHSHYTQVVPDYTDDVIYGP